MKKVVFSGLLAVASSAHAMPLPTEIRISNWWGTSTLGYVQEYIDDAQKGDQAGYVLLDAQRREQASFAVTSDPTRYALKFEFSCTQDQSILNPGLVYSWWQKMASFYGFSLEHNARCQAFKALIPSGAAIPTLYFKLTLLQRFIPSSGFVPQQLEDYILWYRKAAVDRGEGAEPICYEIHLDTTGTCRIGVLQCCNDSCTGE